MKVIIEGHAGEGKHILAHEIEELLQQTMPVRIIDITSGELPKEMDSDHHIIYITTPEWSKEVKLYDS